MFANWLKAIRSTRGSVAIQTGLALIAIIGMVALGTEITYVLYKHREMQSAADAAALGAATAKLTGKPTDFDIEAYAISGKDGYVNGVDGVTVTVNNPPLAGTYAGNDDAVEVIVSQPQALSMVSIFRSGTFDVGARAVALIQNAAQYCIFALDPIASKAMDLKNNAVVANPYCGVAVNSSSKTALTLKNNAVINGPVNVHGGIDLSNNAELNGTPVYQNAAPLEDPYAGRTIQTPPACTSQSGTGSGTISLTAGRFCNGWDYGNNVTVHLAAGTYYIDKKLSINNNAIITGTGGVTLVINGDYAIDVGNNAHVTLTAPTTGPYAGLAIFSGPTAKSTVTQTFNNNTVLKILGAIYMPNQIIEYENNGSTNATRCTQVIGRIINISNNVQLNNDCDNTGTQPIGSATAKLVQ